jgi:hypothetical protein
MTINQIKCELARTELSATGRSAIVTAFSNFVYIYQLESLQVLRTIWPSWSVCYSEVEDAGFEKS